MLLAPDHTFAGWPEARTLPWAEMLPLLQHSGASSRLGRAPLLFGPHLPSALCPFPGMCSISPCVLPRQLLTAGGPHQPALLMRPRYCPLYCLPYCLAAAERHPWADRSALLFFRGAATGDRNLTDSDLSLSYPELLDVQV